MPSNRRSPWLRQAGPFFGTLAAPACTCAGPAVARDAAFWVIRLDPVPEHGESGGGARFISRFTKARQGTPEETEPLEWAYKPDGIQTRVTVRPIPTLTIFRQWVGDGLTSCSDIAEEMGLSKGAVSKMAKKAERDGWLKIDGRNYKLINDV